MADKKQQLVIYIDTNKLFLYPGISGIAQLPFPVDIISDLEVLNNQKLSDLLKTFFQSQKLPPSEVLLVFSQAVSFEKEFPEGEKQEAIQHFLDYVPFDDLISKSFFVNKKTAVVAVNGQLYAILKDALEKFDCTVAGAVGYSMLLGILPELSQKVDIQLILSHFDACKQFNMIAVSQENEVPTPVSKQSEKKTTYLLVGVFGVLVIVLIVVFFISSSSASHTTPPAVVPMTLPTRMPTIPSPKTASQSSVITLPSIAPTVNTVGEISPTSTH